MSRSPRRSPLTSKPLAFVLFVTVALSAGTVVAQSPIEGAAANPFDVPAGHAQAPYGDAMPPIVRNYLRASPYIATGGMVRPGAFEELAGLGFKTLVNLNTAAEGAEAEGVAAEAAGLAYVSLPVGGAAPSAEQIAALAEVVEDPLNYPVLLHCGSSNRVGAAWALYRAGRGVPAEIAIQEGRTVGLRPNREAAVRQILGLPPIQG